MSDLGQVKVSGYTASVNVRDGKPLCPCCQDAMVEVEPNTWQCALGAALLRKLSEGLADVLDNVLLVAPQPADNNHTGER